MLPDEVKAADDAMLVTERAQLMPQAVDWGWEGAPEPLPITIKPWTPEKARTEWRRCLSAALRREGV